MSSKPPNKSTASPSNTPAKPASTPSSPPPATPKEEPKVEAQIEVTIQQYRVAQVFVAILIAGLFTIAIGGVWAIGDIFSQNKFGAFLNLSVYSQIFIVGLILLGLFILSIFLAVLYRRGRDSILKGLFQEIPGKKDVEEYLPGKIITAGGLISLFMVFLGLIIALIQFLVSDTQATGFWAFLGVLTGGVRLLLIGSLILALTMLVLGFCWLWQNGYYFIINKILQRNAKITTSYSFNDKQKLTGQIIFFIVVGAIGICFLGIIWAIGDAIVPTGKWNIFITYPFGFQLTIFGLFFSGIFALLIGSMMFFKRGLIIINTAVFIRQKPENAESKDILPAKIIAGGILASIFLLTLALVVWLISVSFNLSIGQDVGNIFEAMALLSGGLLTLSIGVLILVFLFLGLAFIFIFNNGYYLLISKISTTQEKIDKKIAPESKKKTTVIIKK